MARVSRKGVPNPWKRKRPYEALYNHFVLVMRGFREVHISYEDFLEFTQVFECYYCGDPITWAMYNVGQNGAATNLDRKDNTREYEKDNLVVCCLPCNRSKNNRYTSDEFLVMMKALREYRAQKAQGEGM